MKYVKILSLLAVAAAALMAFAGTASATLTNANGTKATAIHASASGNTSLTGTLTITCGTSTVAGTIAEAQNNANHVEGPVTTLDFGSCGSSTVTTVAGGTLTLTDSDGTTGTVYSKNAKVTVLVHNIFLGTIHCTYFTPPTGTDIGTFTESHHNPGTGPYSTATIHISGVLLIDWGTSNQSCGDPTWEGTYEVTSPDTLLLD